jgi:hypothetical protein
VWRERERARLTVQPPDVLLLLLVVYVVRDEEGQARVDAALLEVLLEQDLEVLVEVAEGRARVQGAPLPVLLGSLGVGQVGLGEVVQVLDDKVTVLSGRLNGERTLARALNVDADAGGETLAGVLVVLVVKLLAVSGGVAVVGHADVAILGMAVRGSTLGVGAARLEVHVGVVVGGLVLRELVGHVVVEVGRGEGDADLLVAKGAREDDLLGTCNILKLGRLAMAARACEQAWTYLERAVLKVLLDVGRQVIALLQVGLHGHLALELGDQLLVGRTLLAAGSREGESGRQAGDGVRPGGLDSNGGAEQRGLGAHRLGRVAGGGARGSAGEGAQGQHCGGDCGWVDDDGEDYGGRRWNGARLLPGPSSAPRARALMSASWHHPVTAWEASRRDRRRIIRGIPVTDCDVWSCTHAPTRPSSARHGDHDNGEEKGRRRRRCMCFQFLINMDSRVPCAPSSQAQLLEPLRYVMLPRSLPLLEAFADSPSQQSHIPPSVRRPCNCSPSPKHIY